MTINTAIDLNIGSLVMKVEGQPILKGTFTYLSAFSQLFTQIEQEQGLDDELVNAFVWSLCHATDANDVAYDIMLGLKHTRMFESLPIDVLLTSQSFYSAKVLMLSLFVRYLSFTELKAVSESIDHLIQALKREKSNYTGLMHRYIEQALIHLQTKAEPVCQVSYNEVQQNPFQPVFDQVKLGHSEEIKLAGVTLRKASIGRLLQSSQYFNQGDTEQTVKLANEAMPTLTSEKFRFFDYFSSYKLWTCRKNHGLIFIYALYLNFIFNEERQSQEDKEGKAYIQANLVSFAQPLKQAILTYTSIFSK